MKSSIAVLLALAAFSAQAADIDPQCLEPGFFEKLMHDGRFSKAFAPIPKASGSDLDIKLHIDVHSKDCAAPDSYGTELKLLLTIQNLGRARCTLEAARLSSHPYGEGSAGVDAYADAELKPEKQYNLNDPKLSRIVLRNAKQRVAVVFTRDKYFYFEDVGPKDKLALELGPAGSYHRFFKSK